MKNKWILLAVALALMAINLLNADFSAIKQLSPADLVTVFITALVIFLIKTGILSALLIGLKKLWEKIRKRDR